MAEVPKISRPQVGIVSELLHQTARQLYSQTNFEYKNQFSFVIKKQQQGRLSLRSWWFAYDYTDVFSASTADMKEYYVLLKSMSNPELQGVDRIKKKQTTIIYHKESRKIEFPLPTLAKHRTQTHTALLE